MGVRGISGAALISEDILTGTSIINYLFSWLLPPIFTSMKSGKDEKIQEQIQSAQTTRAFSLEYRKCTV